jgi:hypothetical protein
MWNYDIAIALDELVVANDSICVVRRVIDDSPETELSRGRAETQPLS